ncbi:hypothetical protein EDD11_003456 [Mortierella claussenii]|nr:hypothetical protein EDD11_003456 [Mortierella claussenii]
MQLLYLAIFLTFIVAPLVAGAAYLVKIIIPVQDPLLLWNIMHGLDFVPIRMRSWLFSVIVGMVNPYSNSINYRIIEVEKGKVRGVMKETKKISNPFRRVHAGALVTFGETIGSFAVFTHLGKKDRAILTNLNAEYIKVARGYLTASSVVPDFKDLKLQEVVTEVIIRNAAYETVAKMNLTWRTELNDE